MNGRVVAVHTAAEHAFSKPTVAAIELVAGWGVRGDAHAGVTVQHRSRVAADPSQPNLRQVHLIQEELHDELHALGFDVAPGQLGENVTTRGIDLLGLPRGARLTLGDRAVVEVTGLRNPCQQINDFRPRLLSAVLDRDDDGTVRRKAGVMGVVLDSGVVRPDDLIGVELPSGPHHALQRV
ncbi:MOSC domain-containing protein [Modestobacter sp. SYSU DS0290]